jgi:DNA-binding transcriptional ArsR family regulator
MANRKRVLTVSQDAHSAADRADAALDAVGDRTRRTILGRLRDGPLSVADLAAGMDVSRPAVSQHLKVLKQAGLVIDRADGTRRLYKLEAQGLESLQSYTSDLWAAALVRFADADDNSPETEPSRNTR